MSNDEPHATDYDKAAENNGTARDVLEAFNAEEVLDRLGEPAEWRDEIVSPVTDADIPPPQ
jgi:hypothetical protein